MGVAVGVDCCAVEAVVGARGEGLKRDGMGCCREEGSGEEGEKCREMHIWLKLEVRGPLIYFFRKVV